MKKRCTESKCRRVFTVDGKVPACPYCGKQYPRLAERETQWILKIYRFPEARVQAIGLLRQLTDTSVKEAFNGVRSGHLELTFPSREQAKLISGILIKNDFGTIVSHS